MVPVEVIMLFELKQWGVANFQHQIVEFRLQFVVLEVVAGRQMNKDAVDFKKKMGLDQLIMIDLEDKISNHFYPSNGCVTIVIAEYDS